MWRRSQEKAASKTISKMEKKRANEGWKSLKSKKKAGRRHERGGGRGACAP